MYHTIFLDYGLLTSLPISTLAAKRHLTPFLTTSLCCAAGSTDQEGWKRIIDNRLPRWHLCTIIGRRHWVGGIDLPRFQSESRFRTHSIATVVEKVLNVSWAASVEIGREVQSRIEEDCVVHNFSICSYFRITDEFN